jgi:FMN phosphatase YigB (HAD superfamily)
MIDGLQAITFDFGNTLVPFPATAMAGKLLITARTAAEITGCDPEEFMRVWNEEWQRQLVEDVPNGRDTDMDVRVVRVLARLRGAVPPEQGRWDDEAIRSMSEVGEMTAILDVYADVFVAETPVPPGIGPMLERLSRHYRLGVLSNWPLAVVPTHVVDKRESPRRVRVVEARNRRRLSWRIVRPA